MAMTVVDVGDGDGIRRARGRWSGDGTEVQPGGRNLMDIRWRKVAAVGEMEMQPPRSQDDCWWFPPKWKRVPGKWSGWIGDGAAPSPLEMEGSLSPFDACRAVNMSWYALSPVCRSCGDPAVSSFLGLPTSYPSFLSCPATSASVSSLLFFSPSFPSLARRCYARAFLLSKTALPAGDASLLAVTPSVPFGEELLCWCVKPAGM